MRGLGHQGPEPVGSAEAQRERLLFQNARWTNSTMSKIAIRAGGSTECYLFFTLANPSTIIIWIWCFVQNPRGEPASQLPDGFGHVLPSQHEPGIKAHIQDYYQAPTFAGSWWESPKFRAPTRAWISSGEAEGAKQVGVVALEACLETIQLGCSVLPQSQNIASKLGEPMRIGMIGPQTKKKNIPINDILLAFF